MRWLSHTLYQFRKLKLEDKYSRRWLFPASVTSISRNRRKAIVTSAVMDGQWEIDARELQMWTYAAEADVPQPHAIMDDTHIHATEQLYPTLEPARQLGQPVERPNSQEAYGRLRDLTTYHNV